MRIILLVLVNRVIVVKNNYVNKSQCVGSSISRKHFPPHLIIVNINISLSDQVVTSNTETNYLIKLTLFCSIKTVILLMCILHDIDMSIILL